MILDYAHEPSTITNALKEGGGQKSESEEDVITEERNTENTTLLALKREGEGTSLVVQWLRSHLPMWGGGFDFWLGN